MKSFGVSPCFPPEGYVRPEQENIDESQKEFDWVNDLFSNLAEGVKLAKKCPICELVPKSNKKIEKKIKQHIISRHKIAIYPCKGEADCSYESPWPAELAEHVEEVHQRQLTEAEEQGSPYPISVRKQNIRKELEKFYTKKREPDHFLKKKKKVEKKKDEKDAIQNEPPKLTLINNLFEPENPAEIKKSYEKPKEPEKNQPKTSEKDQPSTSADTTLVTAPQQADSDDMGLDQVIKLTPRENFRLTRERVKPQPTPNDKVNCPFCKLEMTRRGIVQHVSHSHADQAEKFRKDKAYKEILPFKCDSCKLQFAGKESLRKHFNARGNQKSTCQKPEDDPETIDPVKNIEYNCPGPKCNFFGKLQIILNHLFRHPEMNVKFRTKKSALLPVKCHACSFHFTQRSSLQKHIEKNRCERNQMAVQEQESRKNKDAFHHCPFKCGRLYTSKEKLEEHIEKHHEKEKEVESRIVSQNGSLLKQLKRDSQTNKIICPFPECLAHVSVSYSIFQTHIRKMHSRDEYAFFRMIPTTDSPFVCQKCSWAFTNGAIKNHFHQVAAVCTKNRRTRDEIARKGLHETIKLIFAEPDPSPERTPEERIEKIFQKKRAQLNSISQPDSQEDEPETSPELSSPQKINENAAEISKKIEEDQDDEQQDENNQNKKVNQNNQTTTSTPILKVKPEPTSLAEIPKKNNDTPNSLKTVEASSSEIDPESNVKNNSLTKMVPLLEAKEEPKSAQSSFNRSIAESKKEESQSEDENEEREAASRQTTEDALEHLRNAHYEKVQEILKKRKEEEERKKRESNYKISTLTKMAPLFEEKEEPKSSQTSLNSSIVESKEAESQSGDKSDEPEAASREKTVNDPDPLPPLRDAHCSNVNAILKKRKEQEEQQNRNGLLKIPSEEHEENNSLKRKRDNQEAPEAEIPVKESDASRIEPENESPRGLVDPIRITATVKSEHSAKSLTIPLKAISFNQLSESGEPASKKARHEDKPEESSDDKNSEPDSSEEKLQDENANPDDIVKGSFSSCEKYKFKCSVDNACDVKCETLPELSTHVQIDHSTSDYIRFRATTRYFQFQCEECGYRSLSKEQHERHKAAGQVKNCRKFSAFRFNFGISMECDGIPIIALKLSECSQSAEVEILEKCELCSEIFPDMSNLFAHMLSVHGIEEYYRMRSSCKARLEFKCENCSWFFPSEDSIKSHSQRICSAQKEITKRIDGEGHECPFCKVTLNGQELIKHVDEEHQDFVIIFRLKESKLLKVKCTKCGFHFISTHEREMHNREQCCQNIKAKRDFFLALDGPNEAPTTPEPPQPKKATPAPNSPKSLASNSKSPHLIIPNLSALSPNMSLPAMNSPNNLASISPTLSMPKKQAIRNQYFPNQLQHHQSLANALFASFQQSQPSPQSAPNPFQNLQQNMNFVQSSNQQTSQINRQMLQLDQPNRYGNSVIGTCSYCFVPMRTREEMARHGANMQDCLIFAQTCKRASRLPCPYCGVEITGDSKVLQGHIQSQHSQFYHQFRHMKSTALPFQCVKCNGAFGEMLLLQIHAQSCV
ncbi:unnamed protein product [Oikopleura dioica]|uniref:C2H2-type domain-containing protein n=1 Tax=Oikopleura dioica TaxID=34765 RepID=E4X8P5_OIKDI|nr:unnamed protein product [Oikopleura dioica]